MTILIWLSSLSLTTIVVMVSIRVYMIRAGRILDVRQPSLHSVLQPKVDFVAFFFVVLCRDIFKFVSLKVLLLIGRLINRLKVHTIKFEKKFARVIDAVKGRGIEGKRGSVSIFLRDLEVNKQKSQKGIVADF